LWEEYLNTILRDLGFKHPESNIGKGSIKLFQKNQDIYPDFYIENQIVIDAKYKKLKEDDKVSREDILFSALRHPKNFHRLFDRVQTVDCPC
jgi:5-methylcytosine-specific restriction endonuclease McrBC regulatory subunit McrC